MRFLLTIAALMAFTTNVLATFTVINYCRIPVHFFADLPHQTPDVSGTIDSNGGHYEEDYKGNGRAFKIWTDDSGPGALLVVGYSYEPGDPYVWYVSIEIHAKAFPFFPLLLIPFTGLV